MTHDDNSGESILIPTVAQTIEEAGSDECDDGKELRVIFLKDGILSVSAQVLARAVERNMLDGSLNNGGLYITFTEHSLDWAIPRMLAYGDAVEARLTDLLARTFDKLAGGGVVKGVALHDWSTIFDSFFPGQ